MHTTQGVQRGLYVEVESLHHIARLFFVGADPVRLKILLTLRNRREACVTELAHELRMSVAAVSHHLRILRESRCLKTVRSGRTVCYQLQSGPFTRLVYAFLKERRAK